MKDTVSEFRLEEEARREQIELNCRNYKAFCYLAKKKPNKYHGYWQDRTFFAKVLRKIYWPDGGSEWEWQELFSF